ncbi:ATP-binding cassette sub-family C member 4-like [Brevipalpus obovatus]|uniref:ATP-binding cassette sub-family C member 4-like n=1 Tax=Brevipalpus obovatus TaxID=246614 RepID=UPI003D9E0728
MSSNKFQAPWPADEASFLSRTYFIWTWPLFGLAHKKTLTSEDISNCSKADDCERWSNKLRRKWEREVKNKKKPSLFWAVLQTFGPGYLLLMSTLGILTRIILPISQTLLLGYILDFLSGRMEETSLALLSIIGFCLCDASISSIMNTVIFLNQRTAQRIRVSVQKMMMDKLLVTTTSALHTSYGGQLINLVSNDVSRFDQVSFVAWL